MYIFTNDNPIPLSQSPLTNLLLNLKAKDKTLKAIKMVKKIKIKTLIIKIKINQNQSTKKLNNI